MNESPQESLTSSINKLIAQSTFTIGFVEKLNASIHITVSDNEKVVATLDGTK